MTNLFASVAPGAIITKNAPKLVTKDSPVKRGDRVELNFAFQPANDDEIKKALGSDVPEGYVAGWASTASRDLYNHEVVAGAFQESIDKRGLSGPESIKLLLDHDWKAPAGVIKVLEYRRGKLWMEAQLDLEVGYVKDRWRILKMMGGANFSVGFMLKDYEVVIREEDEDDYFLRIDRGDLFEISIVLFPGNEEAQMTFVKARFHDDNPAEDQLFFAKTKLPSWRPSASKNLPVLADDTWDGALAKARVFKAAGFDGDKPDHSIARKAFLVCDASNPDLRGAYKLQIADVVDGKLQVTEGALKAAAARLDHMDLSAEVKAAARATIEHYQERSLEVVRDSKEAPKTLAEFEKALVAKGLVSGRNAARDVALVAKSCPQLFAKQEPEIIREQTPTLDVGKLTEALLAVKKLNAIIAPAAE